MTNDTNCCESYGGPSYCCVCGNMVGYYGGHLEHNGEPVCRNCWELGEPARVALDAAEFTYRETTTDIMDRWVRQVKAQKRATKE